MLGEKIRNLRKENKISQEELAEKLGVSRQSISLWENEQTQPTLENIMALANIFGVSSDTLLDIDNKNDKNTNIFVNDSLKLRRKLKNKILIISIITIIIIAFGMVLFFSNKPANIEEIKDSVVMIKTYDAKGESIASGSGFCAYEKDWIITNFHVIEGARNIKVITDDNEEISVSEILVFDAKNDLAIMKVQGDFVPLALGDEKKIKVKDKVTTISSPKGELNTVTEGIISNADNKDELRITAPISHGSSGGILLDDNNRIIGITSAGYDDAQNLNFAVSVNKLKRLQKIYDNKAFIKANKSYALFASLEDYEACKMDSSTVYSVSSLETFYDFTNVKRRFEKALELENDSWFDIYNNLSEEDKEKVLAIFSKISGKDNITNGIVDKIEEWDKSDFFIKLGVLEKFEYAITFVDIENYKDKDLMFDNVDENYPLEAAEKSLILYLLGNYKWPEIHDENKEDIFDYFDEKYETKDFGAILEVLGYEVVYENDEELTAYW